MYSIIARGRYFTSETGFRRPADEICAEIERLGSQRELGSKEPATRSGDAGADYTGLREGTAVGGAEKYMEMQFKRVMVDLG
jgi:hypothetical protein